MATKRKPPQSDTQIVLPEMRNYLVERARAREAEEERIKAVWEQTISFKPLYLARFLITCGLPVTRSPMKEVNRVARLGKSLVVTVNFRTTSDYYPLPYGADRTLIYFICHKVVTQQAPIFKLEHANEYMRLFHMDPDSGKNYIEATKRFYRIAYMNIDGEILDESTGLTQPFKFPIIDIGPRIRTRKVEDAYVPALSIANMLEENNNVVVGQALFHELKTNAVPVPLDIIHAAGKRYRLLDYMVFMYYRTYRGQTESFIPWTELRKQFDDTDGNPNRWKKKFIEAGKVLTDMGGPYRQIALAFEPQTKGLLVRGVPLGTEFFPGHEKRGFRLEKNNDRDLG